MIAAECLIHSTAVVTGAVVSARLLTRKPQPIEKMVAKLDLRLAERVAHIASGDSFDPVEWRKLSLWRLYRQATLLTRIAVELSKLHPEQFASIPAEQKCNLALMRFRAAACLLEHYSCVNVQKINALECARCFLQIFDVTETLIVGYDAGGFRI
jgi:hypothetical protein